MLHIPGYSVKQKIYEGKKIIIYSGIRLNDNIPILLKLLHSEYPSLYDVARLKKEYELNQKINSDNVLKIYSIETYEKTPVLISENFGGEFLQKILNTTIKFNLKVFLDIAIKLSQSLIDIHNSNIIHKSIKPNTVIIDIEKGLVKLTGFGNASFFSKENGTIDAITNLDDNLDYISPEQTGRMNRSLDYRTDFYSLGILFYKMLTGSLPFKASDKLGIIHCHLAVKPTPLNEIDLEIPKVISDIVEKLIEKMPENRYQKASDLKRDLQKCMDVLIENGSISNFKIGQREISDAFKLPDKLYGREQEIKTLKSVFKRIKNNSKEAIMVAGYPGVGKSQLVSKVQESIKKQSGYFISGKFDQFEHDIPYSALINSFKDLIQQILNESQEQVEVWKRKLLNALGPNGQLIVNFIPEIEKIIGKQQEIIEAATDETKNRFFKAFKDFVRTFCEGNYPLIIFLDDLQWADLSSLKLIEILLGDTEIKNMLFIGAYRYNEINETHPLRIILNNIQKENIIVNTIFLKPLKLNHIKQLISETFHCDLNESNSLAQLCLQKTEGNPFFLSQFLYSLYKDQLIWFNREEWKWQWDLENIQNAQITDNVIKLITTRMLKLPKNTIEILKLAACIGNQFDLNTLSVIFKNTFSNTYNNLFFAIKEGLILPNINTFSSPDKMNDLIPNAYTFLHDHVQQAAYSLIEEEHRKEIHLKIGRLMLSATDFIENEAKVLDIVNQLNFGIELVNDPFEKEEIANLELTAAKIAKKSTAYDIAYKYSKIGMDLIQDNGWKNSYKLMHSLYVEASEIACLNGDFQSVEEYSIVAINNSQTVLDKVKLYEIKIIAYTIQNKKLEVIDTALFVLNLLGMNFPRKPNLTQVLISFAKTKLMSIGRKPASLFKLPEMTNSSLSAALRIMVKMGMSTYMISPNLFLLITLKAVRLYVKYGNLDSSPIGYAAYGMLLCYIGDIDSGHEFGKLSLKLLDKFNAKEYEAQTIVLINSFISSWKLSTKNTLNEFINAYLIGLETGNINYACTAACLYSIYAYYSGENLADLERKMSEYSKVMQKVNNKEALITQSIYQQSVLNLIGLSGNTCCLKGTVYDEDKMIPIHLEAQDIGTLCNAYINKSILSYIFTNYDIAIETSSMAEKYLSGVNGTLTVPVFYFYNSLIMLATLHQCSLTMQKKILNKIYKNQEKMKKWSRHAETNFLHKFYLVEAEISRVLGNNLNAVDFYEKAIKLASDNGYIQEEALSNELAAKFYISIGNKKISKVYMEEAIYCYTLWGATAKINQLKKLYPQILNFYKINSVIDNVAVTLERKSIKSSMLLDTETIIKATHAISKEIKLEELLKKLVYILLENAGAQKVLYLVKKERNYIVQAKGSVEGNSIKVLNELNFESDESLPNKIIHYVERSMDTIILNDPSDSQKYISDPYIINNKPKSIMCMPVLSKGNILGILYLENSLIEGAFNDERIEILKIISSQLAISLENATLYTNLERSEKELRKHHDELETLIEQRTAKLKEEIIERKKAQKLLEEMATHDNLTGLANRKLFQSKLDSSLKLAKDNRFLLGILFIDLDGFKEINDTLGHDSGDMVLKTIAKRLLKTVRKFDTVSRFGGDEFIIIMENPENTNVIIDTCQKIIDEVSKSIVLGKNEGNVTASIGVSIFPIDATNMNELIKKADNAMYIAKKSGKNKVVFN